MCSCNFRPVEGPPSFTDIVSLGPDTTTSELRSRERREDGGGGGEDHRRFRGEQTQVHSQQHHYYSNSLQAQYVRIPNRAPCSIVALIEAF